MDRNKLINEEEILTLFRNINRLNEILNDGFQQTYKRDLPFNEALFDRWERAQKLGFGTGTSIYDSSLIFLPATVGSNCWIGPYTILDGSGGLNIGDYCTISAGVHIYTHDNVMQTLSGGKEPIQRNPVTIGNNVYIGPNAIIAKGVHIGDYSVIGVGSYVNKNIPSRSIVVGQPARIIGEVLIEEKGQIKFKYHK